MYVIFVKYCFKYCNLYSIDDPFLSLFCLQLSISVSWVHLLGTIQPFYPPLTLSIGYNKGTRFSHCFRGFRYFALGVGLVESGHSFYISADWVTAPSFLVRQQQELPPFGCVSHSLILWSGDATLRVGFVIGKSNMAYFLIKNNARGLLSPVWASI